MARQQNERNGDLYLEKWCRYEGEYRDDQNHSCGIYHDPTSAVTMGTGIAANSTVYAESPALLVNAAMLNIVFGMREAS